MKRCPVCNARYSGKRLCHRCKTDLGKLIDIREKAREHAEQAVKAFMKNDFEQMFFHSGRSYRLYETHGSTTLFACASILLREFELALYLWLRLSS